MKTLHRAAPLERLPARVRLEPLQVAREPGLYGRSLRYSPARLAAGRLVGLAATGAGAWYLAWRWGTLEGAGALGVAFYAAEALNFLFVALAALLLLRMRDRTRDERGPALGSLAVFVPVCGEPVAMIEETLRAALAISYPHTTYLLNDGRLAGHRNWHEVERLARRYGVPCLTRTSGARGKAGNLNLGLLRSRAQFVAVVDADHRARPDLADELLGYFADADVAVVTTPQQFEGPASDPLNNRELFFYRALQPAKDAANAAFSCGNAAVYRRTALEEIGGFSEWNLLEDLHTTYELHARGWRSVYHPRALTIGKAPATASALAKQRLAWATDSLRIFFRDNPLLKRGLSPAQRLHYLHTTGFYVVGMTQVVFLLAPTLYLLWRVPVMRFDSTREYLLASGPYFLAIALFLIAFAGFRGALRAVQQLLFLAPVYLVAGVRALTGIGARGRVTEKARQSRFSTVLLPQAALIALGAAGLAWAVTHWEGGLALTAGWSAALLALLAGFVAAVGLRAWLARGLGVSLRGAVLAAVAVPLATNPLTTPPATLGPRSFGAPVPPLLAAPAPKRFAALAPPRRGAYLGVTNPSLLRTNTEVRAWARANGARPQIVNWYQQWGSGETRFRRDWLGAVAKQGAVPMITWEPWAKPEGSVHGPEQPRYSLASITAGRHDRHISTWARAAARYRGPILLRPMHEMNGFWYPWSIRANGGDERAFVRAWRHVHGIFTRAGATNVRWVWAVNTFAGQEDDNRSLADYYPGGRYVDWVSVTGFNWGTSSEWSGWQSADATFGETYRALTAFRKPVMISEIATVHEGGDAALWIEDALRTLRTSYPRVKALVWFDSRYPGGIDFRLAGTQRAAFRRAVADGGRYWRAPVRIIPLDGQTRPRPPGST